MNFIRQKTTRLLAMLLVMSSLLVSGCGSNAATAVDATIGNTSETVAQAVTEAETTTPAPKSTEVSLMMIGDMLIHEGVYKSGLQDDGTYNFDHLFKNILPDVKAADISIVNQGTILGGTELGLSGYPAFNSPYEIADAISKAGFNVVLHATNHTLDKGLKGVNNDINYWKNNFPDIKVLGINENEEQYNSIYVYEKDDFKISILNYTYGTNGIPLPSSNPYVVNLLDEDKIRTDVAKAKELSDLVIVCPHWGTEYVYTPDSWQKKWTNLFLELGVDVVIGAHPHVIEPVEVKTRDDGHQMLVYYSLGNFVSNQDHSPRMLGAMAKVTMVKDDSGAYVKSYSVVPLVTQKLFGKGQITTYKLSDYTQTLASQNAIRRDENGADFSLSFCQNLAQQVFGDMWTGEVQMMPSDDAEAASKTQTSKAAKSN